MSEKFADRIDVHQNGLKLVQQHELLENSRMLPDNKRLIWDFVNYCKVDPKIGDSRTIKYMYTLRRISELVDKPFRQMDRQDIIKLLAKLQEMKSVKGRPFSPNSLQEFRKTISKFWRWFYFDEYYGEAPPPVKGMRVGVPKETGEPEVYTKEEIQKIIQGMGSPRDKAFFSCLYDLQCRVGELLTRRMRHVRFTDEGDIQMLIEAEKTRIRHWETLFESVSALTTWLRLHPVPDYPNAPLWTMKRHHAVLPLTYAAARKHFLTVCRRDGIWKGRPNKMHMLRKSKATHDLADGVPITYIESRGSWAKGSKALRDCYLSVIQKDKDQAYRKKYDMESTSQTQKTSLRRCSRCDSVVEFDAKFCVRCGMPVDLKVALEIRKLDLGKLVDSEVLSDMVKRHVSEEAKD